MSAIRRYFIPSILFVVLVLLAAFAFAQVPTTDGAEVPSIDQLVSGIMQMVGTYLVAYIVNIARAKWGVIQGSVFLIVVVNVLGLAVNWLQAFLGVPGHSWLLSFFATFGAVFISQVIAQLNTKTGPAQYVLGTAQTPQK